MACAKSQSPSALLWSSITPLSMMLSFLLEESRLSFDASTSPGDTKDDGLRTLPAPCLLVPCLRFACALGGCGISLRSFFLLVDFTDVSLEPLFKEDCFLLRIVVCRGSSIAVMSRLNADGFWCVTVVSPAAILPLCMRQEEGRGSSRENYSS